MATGTVGFEVGRESRVSRYQIGASFRIGYGCSDSTF